MRFLFNIMLSITCCSTLLAQDINKAIIVMKSGSILEAQIVEWNSNEQLVLLSEGIMDIITISQRDIHKIFPSGEMDAKLLSEKAIFLNNIASHKDYNFPHTGFYATAKAQFITGNEGDRANAINGFGVSVSAGHRFTRMLGVGGGIGYDQFIWNSGEEMIPVFAELNGFLTPSLTSLFYNIQAGYSIALSDERYAIESAKGGMMIYPSVGVRFGSAENKITLDIGYKFQNATYIYTDLWTPTSSREQNVTFKRMTIRFGVIL